MERVRERERESIERINNNNDDDSYDFYSVCIYFFVVPRSPAHYLVAGHQYMPVSCGEEAGGSRLKKWKKAQGGRL